MANNFYKSIDEAFDRFEVGNKGMVYQNVANSVWIPVHVTIECFHSRGQHLCKCFGTKEIICIRKEFISHRTGLGHQHGRRFIVLGHQYGRRDVMWKHSIVLFKYNVIIYYNLLICFSQIYVKKNILKIPPHVLLPEDKVKKWLFPIRLITIWRPNVILSFILLHEKLLQFDWLRTVVFQLNLKYLHMKITNLLWVV